MKYNRPLQEDGTLKPWRELTREERSIARRKVLPENWRFMKKNGPAPRSTLKRFFEKIDKNGPIIYPHLTPCWMWKGRVDIGGYGKFSVGSRKTRWRDVKAHRYIWQFYNGDIPKGMEICHHCDNPPCANIAHLFIGSRQDNVNDAMAKGRVAKGDKAGARTKPMPLEKRVRGEKAPNHKLDWGKVAEIRRKYFEGATRAALGREYDVSSTVIFHIVHNNKWKIEFSPQNQGVTSGT